MMQPRITIDNKLFRHQLSTTVTEEFIVLSACWNTRLAMLR